MWEGFGFRVGLFGEKRNNVGDGGDGRSGFAVVDSCVRGARYLELIGFRSDRDDFSQDEEENFHEAMVTMEVVQCGEDRSYYIIEIEEQRWAGETNHHDQDLWCLGRYIECVKPQ